MKFRGRYLLGVLAIVLFSQCAVETAPLGGPKDDKAPKIDSLRSTPNQQVFFEKQDIQLVFNEWINLRDAFNQVVVSPPLEFAPEIDFRGKKVKFKFHPDEVLKENVTYTINFGESIQDYTEGNKASNIRFVFSTGAIIDSLTLSGKVIDASTKEGAEEVFVLLYDNLSDSVVYNEKPYYFAKTEKGGGFKFENLREDTFKLFVLGDQNLNYIYDQEAEGTGFLIDPIYINDTLPGFLNIEYFTPEIPLQFFEARQGSYGFLKLAFNRSPYELDIQYPEQGKPWYQEIDEDTLIIHYSEPITEDTLFLLYPNASMDTVLLEVFDQKLLTEKEGRFFQVKAGLFRSRKKLRPKQRLEWIFEDPILSIDTGLLSLKKDSLTSLPVILDIDSTFPNRLFIDFKRKEGDTLELISSPGFAKSIRGIETDTIIQSYIVDRADNYGLIKLSIDSLDAGLDYVIHLKKGNSIIEKSFATSVNKISLQYEGLSAGDYSIYIIEDANKNGRWDPGSYREKKFSERWIEKKLQALRTNWELEADINWTEEINKSSTSPKE